MDLKEELFVTLLAALIADTDHAVGELRDFDTMVKTAEALAQRALVTRNEIIKGDKAVKYLAAVLGA